MIRVVILAATAAIIISMLVNSSSPKKSVQIDYCLITYPAAGQDEAGIWHKGWARGYGPCSLLDRYEQI